MKYSLMVLVYKLYISLCVCLCVAVVKRVMITFIYNRKVLTLNLWASSVISTCSSIESVRPVWLWSILKAMGMSEAAGDHITLISNWTPKRTICPNTSSLIIALSKGRTLLGDCDFPFVLLQELGGVPCASIPLNRGHSPTTPSVSSDLSLEQGWSRIHPDPNLWCLLSWSTLTTTLSFCILGEALKYLSEQRLKLFD